VPDVHQRRVLWHCRRGMQELDVLLSRYARERYAGAPAARQAAFEALLELPDPQIADYLLGFGLPADAELAAVVTAILARA
jgi:antitoxin CptB